MTGAAFQAGSDGASLDLALQLRFRLDMGALR
jgi:hypothetical protein